MTHVEPYLTDALRWRSSSAARAAVHCVKRGLRLKFWRIFRDPLSPPAPTRQVPPIAPDLGLRLVAAPIAPSPFSSRLPFAAALPWRAIGGYRPSTNWRLTAAYADGPGSKPFWRSRQCGDCAPALGRDESPTSARVDRCLTSLRRRRIPPSRVRISAWRCHRRLQHVVL